MRPFWRAATCPWHMPTSWHSGLEAARRHAFEAERHLIWQMAIIEELARDHKQEAADQARKAQATCRSGEDGP